MPNFQLRSALRLVGARYGLPSGLGVDSTSTKLSRLLTACLLLGALLAASPALADDAGRWTVALKAGQVSVNEGFFTSPGTYTWSVEDEDASAGLAVAYSFHRYLAFEAAYTDLGRYPSTPGDCPGEVCLEVVSWPDEVEFTGASLSFLPQWPVTESFVLYGRLGVFDWRGDTTPSNARDFFGDLSGTDLLVGVGAQLGLTDGLGVQLEYETTDLYDSVSLGASWTF